MHTLKKLLTGAIAVYLLTGATAYAGGIVIEPVLNLAPAPVYAPPPPVYIAPQPYVVAPSPAYVATPWVGGYDPHHRRHDWEYWHAHHEHEMHEHEMHDHDHWDHDHR